MVVQSANEPTNELKIYALEQLNSIVDLYWAEIADEITKIEILYEDKLFPQRNLAALVASKVYYHLGEYEDSLQFALGAGKLNMLKRLFVFRVNAAKAIDKYIELQHQKVNEPSVQIDPTLLDVVQRMFQRCFDSKEYKQAIGISLESLRLDILEKAISESSAPAELLAYVLDAVMTFIQNLEFRNKVLKVLVNLYHKLSVPDYISISQCLLHLNEPSAVADLLTTLIKGSEKDQLMAYQVSFDIEDNATQDFTQKVIAALPALPTEASSDPSDMQVDDAPLLTTTAAPGNSPLSKLHNILSGKISVKLHLEFLYRNNKTDLLILKNTKNAFDSRSSAQHSCISFANAFQNAGTTNDEFLRQSLEWLSRASNWTKFSATAGLGVIHKGHLEKAMALLAPYLPQEGVSGSPYSEGGALYALGLINGNHGASVLPYLAKALKNTQNETLQHGAALGLGVAGMATKDDEIYENLKAVLYNDSAVAGEAAGLSMGLVMLGSGSPKAIEEMIQYAHDTQHEKIIRGLSMGIAITMYGREEAADATIEQLCMDKDPILRYGGAYTVAMAYAGTGDNKAIKKLLHIAVSDVNDDVRRASVIALGFILFKTPESVPKVVQLLSESYNPHVRYGATLALGIACAGTGLAEALDILQPMTKDTVEFVRQGALIALAMVLIQQNEHSCPKSVEIRKLYETTIADKRADSMSRLGSCLGQGIIDAGGRNVTISLQSRNGHNNIPAIVGMAVFTQFWYWYPLSHFLSLTFTPTGIIGLNKNLEAVQFKVTSNAKPSLFAYPPQTVPPSEVVVEKVATAVLSTTAKSKARAKKAGKEAAMDVDEKKEESPVVVKKEEEDPNKHKKFEVLDNFSRVTPQQAKYISMESTSRYQPVKNDLAGIVLLQDKTPNLPEELVANKLGVPVTPSTTTTTQ